MTPTLDTILGRAFAGATSESQAELLNAAADSMKLWSAWQREMQLSFIADQLDPNGRRFIRDLAAHVAARETP